VSEAGGEAETVELALSVVLGVGAGVAVLVPVGEPVGVCVGEGAAVALPDCEALPVTLALPQADETWLRGFSAGLHALADAHGCELIGGDTTRGPLNLCITVFGEVPAERALRRDRARVGDDIWVSGSLGGAAWAVADRLRGPFVTEPGLRLKALDRLERPQPQVALGLALTEVGAAAIDLSDGLMGDLSHVLERSSLASGADLGARIEFDQVPCHPVLRDLPLAGRAELALAGGDDYELLFTASPDQADEVMHAGKQCGVSITCIGRITPVAGVQVLDLQGLPMSRRFASFEHFAH
jgi:thiamine-monophosphate kinase